MITFLVLYAIISWLRRYEGWMKHIQFLLWHIEVCVLILEIHWQRKFMHISKNGSHLLFTKMLFGQKVGTRLTISRGINSGARWYQRRDFGTVHGVSSGHTSIVKPHVTIDPPIIDPCYASEALQATHRHLQITTYNILFISYQWENHRNKYHAYLFMSALVCPNSLEMHLKFWIWKNFVDMSWIIFANFLLYTPL